MVHEKVVTGDVGSSLRVALDDGWAERMGSGCYILFREEAGEVHSFAVHREDLEKLLALAD